MRQRSTAFLRAAGVLGLMWAGAVFWPSAPFAPATASAQGYDSMYSRAEIALDGARLKTAVEKIYRLGIVPVLTSDERRAIGPVRFEFPMPTPDSALLNFYAYRKSGEHTIGLPLLSLKQLEDLTTAYAWLHLRGYSLSTIDLYFAKLRHKLIIDWPGGRFANILSALGVPKDAYKERDVDTMSLALRNEAFAFIIAHELGHLLYRHRAYADITTAQARADELQSDQFALDVLVRTNTPPMGAVLFFQAQAYAMPHRGEFDSHTAWVDYLKTVSTHPLSTDRIANMARTISNTFARRRPNERATWMAIGNTVSRLAQILEDVNLQRCVQKTAMAATLADLAPTQRVVGLDACL